MPRPRPGAEEAPAKAGTARDRGLSRKTIPIFVISYNRGFWLAKVIETYRNLAEQVEIVIHDNGSDNDLTLRQLGIFCRAGIKVFRGPKIVEAEELESVNETITRYFNSAGWTSRYVVTDCDIDMSIASADAISVYDELLDLFPEAGCVGPMLRIRDIPRKYPLFNWVMNRHIEQFWRREPEWAITTHGKIAFLHAEIDSSFALHRADEPYRRNKMGIRVYHPYEARHLDWYLTKIDALSYFDSSSAGIAHWSSRIQYEANKDAALLYPEFTLVEGDADELHTRKCRL